MTTNAIGTLSSTALPQRFPANPADATEHPARRRAPGPSTAVTGLFNALALSAVLWGMGLALWAAW